MSDDQQPSFFGGLPPRNGLVSQAPAESGRRKRSRWSVIIAAMVFIVAAVTTVTIVIGNMAAPSSSVSAEEQQLSEAIAADAAAEQAKAEAIIAAGGGAVRGHVVSPELCKALDGFVAAGGDAMGSQKISADLLAATEALADVNSPNQSVYQGFIKLQKDPESISSIADAQAMSADFVKAAQADLVTCM